MTPAPSSPLQSSWVSCGQSRSESSLPVHLTLSIAKLLETRPKWDRLVGLPKEYPSILNHLVKTQNCIFAPRNRLLIWKWTCKSREHFGRCAHHHRQAGCRQECFLHVFQIPRRAWPLANIKNQNFCVLIETNLVHSSQRRGLPDLKTFCSCLPHKHDARRTRSPCHSLPVCTRRDCCVCRSCSQNWFLFHVLQRSLIEFDFKHV